MKIKEILTKEELEKIETWYGIYNTEQLENILDKHIIEMELKEFILYEILEEIRNLRYTINDIGGNI